MSKEETERITEIKDLVASGDLSRAIKRTLDLTREMNQNKEYLNEVVILSSNLYGLESKIRQNIIETNTAEIIRNKFLYQLLSLLDRIHEQNLLSKSDQVQNSPLGEIEGNFIKPNIIVLEGAGLTNKYKKSDFKLKINEIILSTGEITGIIGENSSGKTSLCKILAGELAPDRGILKYIFPKVKNKNWLAVKKNISYLPQDIPSWKGDLQANLYLEASLQGMKAVDNIQVVNFWLQRLGLHEYCNSFYNGLSGGYKLRFSLAKALITNPRLLILDEPFANLDVKAKGILSKDLRDLTNNVKFPLSTVIASQDLTEIEGIADKIIILKNGKVLFYGRLKKLERNFPYSKLFELKASINIETLKAIFDSFSIKNINNTQDRFIIETSREIDKLDVIKTLIEKKIDFSEFIDISGSSKRYFYDSSNNSIDHI